jgi:dTDP-D-glucose 4,6-dehydratase
MLIPITGGAGFLRMSFSPDRPATNGKPVVSPDRLTYAGRSEDLREFKDYKQKIFIKGCIDGEVFA